MMQVAEPFESKTNVPEVPPGDKVRVSVVMAILTIAAAMLINWITVPTGKATLLLAGIVNVRAVLSPTG